MVPPAMLRQRVSRNSFRTPVAVAVGCGARGAGQFECGLRGRLPVADPDELAHRGHRAGVGAAQLGMDRLQVQQ